MSDNFIFLILASLFMIIVGGLLYRYHAETQEYLKQGYHWAPGVCSAGEWKK